MIPLDLTAASEAAIAIAAFLLAYAETHYRFKFIPSRYFKKEPEIIFDMPRRVEPNLDLPILLLIKDAHHYPVHLKDVRVQVQENDSRICEQHFLIDKSVDRQWFFELFTIPRSKIGNGQKYVLIECTIIIHGRAKVIRADNYALTKHQPYRCFFADETLPLTEDYYTGDLHTHSWFTSDQVEFGAPLEATVAMAKATGHAFTAITDHSYDLDDEPVNFLKNDPELKKWRAFQAQALELNSENDDFVLLPGEEVSCGNSQGENVHFLVFNNPAFIPGAGDSGEKWLQTKPDLSIAEVIQSTQANALHFAAHPQAPIPFLQRLLLNRNVWRRPDYQHENLNGLQIWNGHPQGRREGLESWKKLLLDGQKKFIIAGSDAHGNFNRYRQIRMPHLILDEHEKHHLFGQHRTIAHLPDGLSLNNLILALKTGACSISSGPFLAISAETSDGEKTFMGGTIVSEEAELNIMIKSTSEFAPLEQVVLYCGDLNEKVEKVIHKISLDGARGIDRRLQTSTGRRRDPVYYRAELRSSIDGKTETTALTNPIWHEPL